MDYGFVALGLVLLLVGGEGLVSSAVRLATTLGLSPAVIGLTIVGFGTSSPELLTSLSAALSGAHGISIGNVVGSNIANILLILGVTALIAAVPVAPGLWRRDGLFMVAITLVFALALSLGTLSRITGLIAVVILAAYLWRTLSEKSDTSSQPELTPVPGGLWRGTLGFVAGLVGLMLGAHLLVRGAVGIASQLGVSETIIGLTIVAIGTSLPELATSVIAARRGHTEVAVGNIIGSNIFNILGILGLTALILPLPVPADVIWRDAGVMVLAAVLFIIMTRRGWQISRSEGAILLALYGGYLLWLILS